MTLKARILTIVLTSLLGFPVQAAVPAELSKANFRSSFCNIASMDVSFNISESFGEPVITSSMTWLAGPNTRSDCLSGITYLWVRVRTERDELRYLKVRPKINDAGITSVETATESPSWSALFCDQASDSAICEPESRAKSLLISNLRFEDFNVVTQSLAVSTLTSGSPERNSPKRSSNDDGFSLDSLLADAIDSAISPELIELPPESSPAVQQAEPEDPAMDRKARAEATTGNVVTLISAALARYTTPAHTCESSRTIANWVQAQGSCKLNFRSESSHDYLCTDNGSPRTVKATRSAQINFAEDITEITNIRHSGDGWAALVLVLNQELQTTTEGEFKINRWQITADDTRLPELQDLAGNLLTLTELCREGTG